MLSFGQDDVIYLIHNQVFSCIFEILFCLNDGTQYVEYKSWIYIQEHFNLKKEIVMDAFKRNLMAEHRIRQ